MDKGLYSGHRSIFQLVKGGFYCPNWCQHFTTNSACSLKWPKSLSEINFVYIIYLNIANANLKTAGTMNIKIYSRTIYSLPLGFFFSYNDGGAVSYLHAHEWLILSLIRSVWQKSFKRENPFFLWLKLSGFVKLNSWFCLWGDVQSLDSW